MQNIMKTKFLLIILLSFLTSCGARKKELEKQASETRAENNTDLQQTYTFNNQTQTTTNLLKFLSDKGLKITSDGQP